MEALIEICVNVPDGWSIYDLTDWAHQRWPDLQEAVQGEIEAQVRITDLQVARS